MRGGGMRVVVKLGGHAFPYPPNPETLSVYADALIKIKQTSNMLAVVTGGGQAARAYIDAARRMDAEEGTCDQLGIEMSRLNAQLLILKLRDQAYPTPPHTLQEVKKLMDTGKIIVLGGLSPGHSTTAVGALVAEAIKADMYIISSDVEGIYTADPKTHPSAKKLSKITTQKALDIALKGKTWAGTYQLDPLAVKVIERSKMPTRFIDGRNPRNLQRASAGENIGTLITTE